jgi:hypothetical protein
VAAYLGARSRQVVDGDAMLFLPLLLFAGAWIADAVAWVVAGGIDPLSLITRAPVDAAYSAAAGLAAFLLFRLFVGD